MPPWLIVALKKVGSWLLPIFLSEIKDWIAKKNAIRKQKKKNKAATKALKDAKTEKEFDDAVEELARRTNKS